MASSISAESSAASGSRLLGISPSKILSHMLHPLHHKRYEAKTSSPSKKRRTEDEGDERGMKRVRGGLVTASNTSADIIVIDDDDDDGARSSPGKVVVKAKPLTQQDYGKVLTSFRLKPQKVGYVACYTIPWHIMTS